MRSAHCFPAVVGSAAHQNPHSVTLCLRGYEDLNSGLSVYSILSERVAYKLAASIFTTEMKIEAQGSFEILIITSETTLCHN
jgi:hypothetical protein